MNFYCCSRAVQRGHKASVYSTSCTSASTLPAGREAPKMARLVPKEPIQGANVLHLSSLHALPPSRPNRKIVFIPHNRFSLQL